MEADEILRRAWAAVEKAGVPESLQEVAFREAVEILKGEDSTSADTKTHKGAGPKKTQGSGPGRGRTTPETPATEVPDENTFFSQLAHESGIDETDLSDIFNLMPDGRVQIQQPARELGDNAADQARAVIVLVAGARSKGLGENPVSADAVRAECKRKNCYQGGNFAPKHLGPLKGFNAGSTPKQIVLNSKWLPEFTAAVNKLHGRGADDEG